MMKKLNFLCTFFFLGLALSAYAQPANDDLCNAESVVIDDPEVTGNNTGATAETNEPEGSCWNGTGTNETVWYEFTPTTTNQVTVTTDFPNTDLHDTHIAVYTVGDCGDMTTLTEVACSEDEGDADPNGWTSIVEFTPTSGTTYYVQVDGYNFGVGEFLIQVLQPTCPAPSGLTASNVSLDTVDISWTAGGSETMWNLEYGESGFTQGSGTTVSTADNPHTLTGLNSGTDYEVYVQADCGGGDTSDWVGPTSFTTLFPPPANDECADAVEITPDADLSCPSPVAGTTEGATQSETGCTGTADDDVWYSFTASDTLHQIIISNTGGSSDIVTQVLDGCSGTELACQDSPNSPIEVGGLTMGNTYVFRIYTWSSTSTVRTDFEVCVGTPPPPIPGQICGTAIDASAIPYSTTDSTSNYFDDYTGSPGSSCGSTNSYLNGDDVVYKLGAAADATYDIALSGLSGNYAGIFIYADCADIGTACINGDVNSSSTDDISLQQFVAAGDTVYIVISTWASPQSIDYTLDIVEVTCPAPTDFTADNIMDVSTDLSWTPTGTESSWEIEYGLAGFTPGTGTTITTSDNPHALSGLTPETGYDAYLWVDCGGGDLSDTIMVSFTTQPLPGDCANTSRYPDEVLTAVNDGFEQEISTCQYYQEYNEIGGITPGENYVFEGIESPYITVREDSATGQILAEGYSPLSVVPNDTLLYVHWNVDEYCNTETGCKTTTYTCTSCAMSVAEGTAETCETAPTVAVSGTEFIDIMDNGGDIIASINPNGEDLGDVAVDLYTTTTDRVDDKGDTILRRNFTITPTTQPTAAVDVRLYFDSTDLATFPRTIGDVNFTKTGQDCGGDPNDGGEFIAQNASGSYGSSDYYVELSVSSFSTLFAHSGDVALPVELLSFTAEAKHADNVIRWTTTEEIDASHFALQRSGDGVKFRTIEQIEAENAGTTERKYEYMDRNVSDSYFYRLQMVDFDGSMDYSEVITVFRENNNHVRLFPNPAKDELFVEFDAELKGEDVQFRMYDVTGKSVLLKELAGEDNFGTMKLDIPGEIQGMMILEISSDTYSEKEQVMILK